MTPDFNLPRCLPVIERKRNCWYIYCEKHGVRVASGRFRRAPFQHRGLHRLNAIEPVAKRAWALRRCHWLPENSGIINLRTKLGNFIILDEVDVFR